MAQQTFEEIAAAVKQAESGGKRYKDDGKTLTTSAKGALGEMQVMPKTIRDPGFGVVPARDKSPDEIARVGRDYLQAMLSKYGDMDKALAAYNMGPGSTDKWIAAGAKLEKLPEETRTYIQRVKGFLEDKPVTTGVSRETPAPRKPLPPSLPPMAAAAPAAAPVLNMKQQVASLGPGYQAALALSFLSDTDDKEDRDTEKEPGIAEKFMAETASRPSALAQFADFKIRSPFPELQPPVRMAGGGQVELPMYDPEGRKYILNEQGSSDNNPPLSQQTIDFLDKEAATPGARDARMMGVDRAIGAALGFLPGPIGLVAGLSNFANSGNLATLAGGVANFFSPPGSQPNFSIPVDNAGSYAGMPAMGQTSYESGQGNPAEQGSDTGGGAGIGGGDISGASSDTPALAQGGLVRRANGSPKEGEQPPPTQQEIDAASKPAFLTPSSGIGRKISTRPGELEAAALQGVSEYPYLLAGSPVDIATMVMRPFGYSVEKPFLGSEDLKERALKAGIRQKPPEGKAARALYELTQLGTSAVNPTSIPRAAARGASAVGKSAAEMFKSNPALPLLVTKAPAQEVSRVMPPVETPRLGQPPVAAAPQIRPVEPAAAPVQQAAPLPLPPTEVNVAPAMADFPVATPVAPPMQAGVPADRPFVGRLDSYIDTLGGPVQLGQLKGQLKGKFRDYDLERVERAFPGMDAKTKLTPDQIKQALSETYSPSKYVSETLPPKEGKYHQYADNVWKAPLGTTNLYLDQAPEALEANALLRKAVQVFSPFLKTQTSSTPTLENLTQARALLASPELLRTVDPGLVTNLSKTFDKVEKNVGLVQKYSDVIKNVSHGFSSPILYVDNIASGGKFGGTGSNQPFFKFAEEAMNAERAALEQKFLAQGLDLRTVNSRVHDEIMSNISLYYINSKKVAAQKVQALAIAEAQKNGIELPNVSLIKWDELSDPSFPGGNPAFKQSLENALEPSRVTVNNAILNIKNVMDPEVKKVGDILYQRGNLYEGKHTTVAGKPYPIGFTRFSEHESTIPGMGAVQGRHFHELQSDLSKDMRTKGTTSGSATKDQAEYNKLRGEVQQAQQKAMGKLEKLEAQKQALIQSGESNPANIKNIDEEFTSVRVALEKETQAAEKRIFILGNRIRGKAPYSLEEPFAGFETNKMVRQQLLMKNAIQSAMRDGKGFATFPGAESNQPTLYVGKIQPNLKQVIKDLGGEKSGLELRQIQLPPDKNGNPINAYGVTWSPEAAARILKNGVPFAKGGMVERQSADNRRYL
jgi:hypothetical protein